MNSLFVRAALSVAVVLALQAPAQAGTIINIKGFSDGVSAGSGVDYPFAAVGTTVHFTNAVTLQLAAGDYSIRDAWGESGAIYDAWDFQLGVEGSWTDHFFVGAYQSGSSDNAAYTLLLDAIPGTGAGHFGGFYSEQAASDAFLGWSPFTLHLSQDTLVGFVAPDYALSDNLGGVSLDIARVGILSSVPEPTNLAFLLAGLAGVVGVARAKKKGLPKQSLS